MDLTLHRTSSRMFTQYARRDLLCRHRRREQSIDVQQMKRAHTRSQLEEARPPSSHCESDCSRCGSRVQEFLILAWLTNSEHTNGDCLVPSGFRVYSETSRCLLHGPGVVNFQRAPPSPRKICVTVPPYRISAERDRCEFRHSSRISTDQRRAPFARSSSPLHRRTRLHTQW